MSRCVVIGHSVYAVKVIEQLREESSDMEFVVCAQEPGLPYDRMRFVEVLAKHIERHEIYYRSGDFYHNLRVQFITDQKISRIHFKRKYITFEDNTKLEFDQLIIANWEKDVWPDLKGLMKRGVFSLRSLTQLDEFLKMSGQVDTVVVQSNAVRGIRIAQSLAVRGKEVVLCVSSNRLLFGVISEESSRRLADLLNQMGIRILHECTVTEVLGELDVRAVRLSVGKVIGCEAVIFADASSDCRFFERFDLKCDPSITVSQGMRASEPGVFALDEAVRLDVLPAEFLGEDDAFLNWQAESLKAGFLDRDFEVSAPASEVLFDIGTRHVSIWASGQSMEGCSQHVRELSEDAYCILALNGERKIISIMTVNIPDRKMVLPVEDLSAPMGENDLNNYTPVFRQERGSQEAIGLSEGSDASNHEKILTKEAV